MVLRRQVLGLPVQIAQVRLPPDGHEARKDGPVLDGDEREAKGRDGGPHLHGVEGAAGHGDLDALNGGLDGLAGEQGLRAEVEDVEAWCEDHLVDEDFGAEGEDAGGVVEVVREEHEPAILC